MMVDPRLLKVELGRHPSHAGFSWVRELGYPEAVQHIFTFEQDRRAVSLAAKLVEPLRFVQKYAAINNRYEKLAAEPAAKAALAELDRLRKELDELLETMERERQEADALRKRESERMRKRYDELRPSVKELIGYLKSIPEVKRKADVRFAVSDKECRDLVDALEELDKVDGGAI